MTETQTKFLNPFELPQLANFDLSKLEVPPAFREYADGAVIQAKRGHEKLKAAVEETTELLESTYTTVTKGASDYGMKVIEIIRINTNTAFDFAEKLLAAKTPAEVVTLANSHASKQLETLRAQTEQLGGLAQKIANKVVGPLSTGMNKVFNAVG
jgi:phasin